MRILNGVKWIALLALISGAANAAVILDGVTVIENSNIEMIELVLADGADGDIYIDTLSKDYIVTQDGSTPPPDADVAISRFSATPSSMVEGGSTIIRWATTNADSCTATGGAGWAGTAISPLSSGSKSLKITTAGTYNLNISCTGTNGPVTDTLKVVVNKVVVDPSVSCSTGVLSGDVVAWEGFWGVKFPEPGYDKRNLSVARYGYRALQFNTGDVDDHGGITTVPTTFTDGRKLGSISACKGDFNVEPECQYVWGANGGIGWSTDGEAGYCQLKKNTTYYLNFTFTDGESSADSSCATNENCIIAVRAVNSD